MCTPCLFCRSPHSFKKRSTCMPQPPQHDTMCSFTASASATRWFPDAV